MISFKDFVKRYFSNKQEYEKPYPVRYSTLEEHKETMEMLSQFEDNGKQKVGIFWLNYRDNVLFGVMKDDAENYIGDNKIGTFPRLHKIFWQKMHHRAVSKNDVESVYYKERNYTMIPRGRVYVREDGSPMVTVGRWWIDGCINGKKVIDIEKAREAIADEFNIPDDFEVSIDEHWDIGRGWSEHNFTDIKDIK